MLVSVVVITYNSEKTILDTLNSIYCQSYEEIELIISDDCSKDSTITIVKEWGGDSKERFRGFSIIESNINNGVTHNCNIGISNAKGEYVQLIAGDDILLSNAIERKVDIAEKKKLDYLICKTIPFGNNDINVKKMQKFCEKGYDILKSDRESQIRYLLKNNFVAGPSGGFYRKKFFEEFGGYDERYPMIEDYPFIFHFLMKGYSLFFLEEELTKYRISDDSLCVSYKSPMWKSLRLFFDNELKAEAVKRGRFFAILRYNLKFIKIRIKSLIEDMK